MITQTVTVTEKGSQNIIIGRRGTYETEQIVFDVSYLIETYGEGTAVLMVRRSMDSTAYPATTTVEEGNIVWTITETDTTYKGHGECELFWYVGQGFAKSVIFDVTVLRDIGDTTQEPPDPYETWIDTLIDLGAETLQNAQDAAQSAANAEAAQDAAESAAEDSERAVSHYPKIVEGYWYAYDTETDTWVNTGIKAEGEDGKDGQDGQDGQDGVIQSVNGKSATSITLDSGDIAYDETQSYASGTVGDALALKQNISTLINGRTNVVLNPWGGINKSNIGDTIDFRTFPLNTCCYTLYQYIKAGFSDTSMPDTDWADNDWVVLRRQQISPFSSLQNSIVTLFNFTKTRKLEMLYFANSPGIKYRWLSQNGSVNYNTFENTINQYSNSYSVTATPSITTDTNNYLQPSGDTTDMSTAIETMLTQTGICNLAPGTFYVSGVDMPALSTIRGSGNATNIVLLDSVTTGYAIKMESRCTIDSVQISGGASTPTITSAIGNRNGIVWQGTAIPGNSTESNGPYRGTIANCHIKYFTGSGIYCYGTGTNISNCLNVANVFINNCTVGVNVAWLSEYHRFTNVDSQGCYYGIINNGGNNTFSNCGFSKNMIGLLMDNTYKQSDNNSHGSFNNCVFNHSGASNDGVAIQIIGCTTGEMFTGCQLFYGETIITESDGIVFANCNFGGGSGTQITITNGGLVMYEGCCFKNAPTVTETGNTATKMLNCYLRDGTAVTIETGQEP